MSKKIRIDNCPFCYNDKLSEYCIDWQGNNYSKCIDCNFVFQNVYEVYDYSKNYWGNIIDPDGIKRDLTRERDFKINNWYGGIINFVNAMPGGRILDVGCGLGYLLSAIDKGWEKIGFDVTDDSFDFINERFSGISLFSGPIDTISKKFGGNSFDVIVCYHVIEHLRNPAHFFKILVNLLSTKGVLIIGTPNIKSFCARWFKGNYRLLGNGHICMFSPAHLKKLFEENNMQVTKKEYPFFYTSYFTVKNLLRLINYNKVSPPFYGNAMTFYGLKKI